MATVLTYEFRFRLNGWWNYVCMVLMNFNNSGRHLFTYCVCQIKRLTTMLFILLLDGSSNNAQTNHHVACSCSKLIFIIFGFLLSWVCKQNQKMSLNYWLNIPRKNKYWFVHPCQFPCQQIIRNNIFSIFCVKCNSFIRKDINQLLVFLS